MDLLDVIIGFIGGLVITILGTKLDHYLTNKKENVERIAGINAQIQQRNEEQNANIQRIINFYHYLRNKVWWDKAANIFLQHADIFDLVNFRYVNGIKPKIEDRENIWILELNHPYTFNVLNIDNCEVGEFDEFLDYFRNRMIRSGINTEQ